MQTNVLPMRTNCAGGARRAYGMERKNQYYVVRDKALPEVLQKVVTRKGHWLHCTEAIETRLSLHIPDLLKFLPNWWMSMSVMLIVKTAWHNWKIWNIKSWGVVMCNICSSLNWNSIRGPSRQSGQGCGQQPPPTVLGDLIMINFRDRIADFNSADNVPHLICGSVRE